MNTNLTDSVPVQRKYTAIPRPLYAVVKQYVEDLLNRGWIQMSKSAYSSPVVCVRKKEGSLRLCIDYRQLNSKTIRDSHPLPRVQDALESLGGNQWFSLLDQGKAYHQGFISSGSRHKTAFATPWGLYEWVRLPMGLKNAPGEFQRFMEHCLDGLRDDTVSVYLILMTSLYSAKHLRIMLTISGKCLDGCVNMGLSLKGLGHAVSMRTGFFQFVNYMCQISIVSHRM